MRVFRVMPKSSIAYRADIIRNNSFAKALFCAETEMNTKTEKVLRRFYNSLRTIENDKNFQGFVINADHIQLNPLPQNNKSAQNKSLSKIGIEIMETINRFVEEHYPKSEISDESKDIDIKNAFSRWWRY